LWAQPLGSGSPSSATLLVTKRCRTSLLSSSKIVKLEQELQGEQRSQNAAELQDYFEQMTHLVLERDLRTPEADSEVQSLARVRTLAIVANSDAEGNRGVTRFLTELDLVKASDPVRLLGQSYLPNADLGGAFLPAADFNTSALKNTNLSGTMLVSANLSGTILSEADLRSANLGYTNLDRAELVGADLSGTNLDKAVLKNADLSEANLTDAAVTDGAREVRCEWGTV
jgi:uncharacterized protein YjbI with pentapeptide repeats